MVMKDGKIYCDICKTDTPAHTNCYKCGKHICKKHGKVDKLEDQGFCYKCREWKDCEEHPEAVEVKDRNLGWICRNCSRKG